MNLISCFSMIFIG